MLASLNPSFLHADQDFFFFFFPWKLFKFSRLIKVVCDVSTGIYYEPDCSSQDLDHGVLVAGYGSDSGYEDVDDDETGEPHKYWLVKNR